MAFEKGLLELRRLTMEVSQDRLLAATSSEADTRAKAITRILTNVLDWPELCIEREKKSLSGYVDYRMKCPHPVLVIEAKRYGRYFTVPTERKRRTYVLETLKSERDHLGKAIRQARQYADNEGIEFACVSNGYQWIIFRAISRNEPWTRGVGIIFRDFKDIEANFTEFWNLLSYDSISSGSLPAHFSSAIRDRVSFGRALGTVLYSDTSLRRNNLSAQLHPLIDGLFRDLTASESEEVLRKCYVVDRKVQGVSREVEELFLDTVPGFARDAGF